LATRVFQCILAVGNFSRDDLHLIRRQNVNVRAREEVRLLKHVPIGTDIIVYVGQWSTEDRDLIRSLSGMRRIVNPVGFHTVASLANWLRAQGLGLSGLTKPMQDIAEPMIPPGDALNVNMKKLCSAIKQRIKQNGLNAPTESIYVYISEYYRTKFGIDTKKVAITRQKSRMADRNRSMTPKKTLKVRMTHSKAGLQIRGPEPPLDSPAIDEDFGPDDDVAEMLDGVE